MSEIDPFIVDSLVQRYPVKGATPAEKREAAAILAEHGRSNEEIAIILRVDNQTARHWGEINRKRSQHRQKVSAA